MIVVDGNKAMKDKVKCSVCGNLIDNIPYEICPVCDWERDLYQEEFPDAEGCANDMSLNQARAEWAKKHKKEDKNVHLRKS